ncbi:hypothetical protein C7S17_4299 [Burkholderia thailandensis]|nr:hypothetical protein [Burkholderia thailandensis]
MELDSIHRDLEDFPYLCGRFAVRVPSQDFYFSGAEFFW